MQRFLALYLITAAISVSAAHADVRLVAERDTDAAFVQGLREQLLPVPAAETRFEARHQAKRAAERLDAYLNSQGYFAARLRASVEAEDGFQPVVTIDPGPRFSIKEISLETGDAAPLRGNVSKLMQQAEDQVGQAALPSEILATERALIRAWKADGYPFVEARPRDVLGDEEAATVEITYSIDPGPRVALGTVNFGSENRLRRRYTDALVPFKPGTLYHPDLMNELTRRIGEVRIFSLYTARLSDDVSGMTEDGEEIRNVELSLTENQRYRIAVGASYSTSEGVGVSSQFVVRNLTRRADRLELDLTLATQERSFGADWLLPNALGYGRDLRLAADGGREETDAFDTNRLRLSGGVDVHASEHLTYSIGLENEYLNEKSADGEREFDILNAAASASLDYTDDVLDPTRGWRAELAVAPGYILGDETTPFVSSVGEVSGYYGFGEARRAVAALRSRVGMILGADASEFPASRRFYGGGGGSARGYAYQAIGPVNEFGAPIGGRSLFELSAEARWRASNNLGYALFVDAASVSTRDTPGFDDMRYGVGIGARYYTAIGPIRLDIATPIDRRDGEDPVQIYISIGQAF